MTNYFVCRDVVTSGIEALTAPLTDSGLRVVNPDTGNNIVVWESNIAGIGLAIAHRFHSNGCGWKAWLGAGAGTFGDICNGAAPQDNGYQLQIAAVKTATAGSGLVAGKTVTGIYPIGRNTTSEPFRQLSDQRVSFAFSPFSVVAQTCAVTTSSVSVNLTPEGGLRASSFTGVNATSTPVGFSLGLNCSGTAAKVGLTLTDVRNPGNTAAILPLTAASTATGLGVQILRNNSPLNFGRDSSVAGNANQLMLATVDGSTGRIDFPFTARYIQTASRVTAGTANAIATATFSYQ
ncbi:fimbrial protein [Herbaspirillum robiniae]|uniref:fimbrial protein n=1 Tax=Herbaspirillum robiniae TaxID=2014887 RepID=UPI003D777D05